MELKPITVIIENPGGSNHKYDYDEDLKCFKLQKIMPAGLVFPFDFGYIPDTKGEDGDPLDIIVISEMNGFPGVCMDCRIIGSIKAEQTEKNGDTMRNDRFLGVPEVSQLFKNVHSINDLPEGIVTQIENFFKNYNDQAGKEFKVVKHVDAEEAYNTIKGN